MKFTGANPKAQMAGLKELPGKINFLVGSDPARWISNIPTYATVESKSVYPGIDLIYYGNQSQLEYDFVVAPGADPNLIRFALHESGKTTINLDGDLVMQTTHAEIRLRKPLVYQTIGHEKHQVNGGYVLLDQHEVGFWLGAYDSRKPLVIDPVLDYATYLDRGVDLGGGIFPKGIAIDEAGSAYVTGQTCPNTGSNCDAFVSKVNPAGSALVYTTFVGGTGLDYANAIAVDDKGSAYITGHAGSRDFPTVNAFQPTQRGGFWNAFVSKLSADGATLIYSTYLGGNNFDEGQGIAVDSEGNAYVTGYSKSPDFPMANAFQPTYRGSQDVFVSKFNPSGTALVYSTYLGGDADEEGKSIAVDRDGNAYITGATQSSPFPTVNPFQRFPSRRITADYDAFISKFNAAGSALVYSTYFGGGGFEAGMGIAVDATGSASVTGYTNSSDFPTANPLYRFGSTRCYDAFVSKFTPEGSALEYSTQLGPDRSTADAANCAQGLGIAVDSTGNTYVTGMIRSPVFPNVNSLQGSYGGNDDAFVGKLNAAGSALLYSTYLGGNGSDKGLGIAIDGAGNAYVMGQTESANFPTTTPSRPRSASASVFLAKIIDADPLSYSVGPRSGAAMTSQGGFGATTVGYARIQPANGTTTPTGLAIFGFRQNNTLVSETAISASAVISSGRIYAEVDGGVNTGIAIVNPSDVPVTLNFYFTGSNGQRSAEGSTTIAANGQLARFLNEAPFTGSISFFHGTFTFEASAPVSAIALRSVINERSEFLVTTLPVADLSATAETAPVVFPQYAEGGGWTTQILLVNPTDDVLRGSVQFYGHGTSVSPGRPAYAALSYMLPARSSTKVRTSSQTSSTMTGWIRVVPDLNNKSPSGVAIFSFSRAGVTVSETGVAAAPRGNTFRIYAESEGHFTAGEIGSTQTGIALANPSADPAAVAFELKTLSGESTGVTGTVIVPATGQTAMFLREVPGFGALPNAFRGVLRVSTASSAGLFVFAFRGQYNERNDFLITATPPTNEIHPAYSSDLFFPHFADGGGYTTQLILFNRSDDQLASGFVRFFTQTGLQFSASVQ
jgi:hypothetical protein